MKIHLINPNTTASMTATAADAARRAAAKGTEIVPVTSSMGPVSIEGYYDEALALPGLLVEIAAGSRDGADAMIIACFDDTGLDAARALADVPVIGICEAAIAVTSFIAQRFTVVTTMERSRLPVEALVHRYGAGSRCRVRAANIPVLSLEDPASGAGELLRAEIATALAEDRAEAIILGCAGMADLVADLSAEFRVPVIDGVAAAVKQAEALIVLGLRTAKGGPYITPVSKPYHGMLENFAPQLMTGVGLSDVNKVDAIDHSD